MSMFLKLVLSRVTILGLTGAMAFTVRPALANHVSCGAVLTQNTTLDSDLSGCPGDGLIITKDDITVDFNGHEVTGSEVGVGIRNEGHDGVTIKNRNNLGNNLSLFKIGILLKDARGNRINEIEANFNEDDIVLRHSDYNWIRENHFEVGTDNAIVLFDSDNNLIEENIASAINDDGVNSGISLLDHSDHNRIRNNILFFGVFGIFVESRSIRNSITGNVASDHSLSLSADGIRVEEKKTTITRNTANNNGDLGIEAVAGVKDGGGNTAQGNGNPAQCIGVVCQ